MSIKCDGCPKMINEGYNPIENKFYCSDCFWKKVIEYLKKTGVISLSINDFKAMFHKEIERKSKQTKVI
jgi:hypothetical protein